MLEHQSLETAIFGHFGPIFGHFGRPWVKFRGTPLLEIGPETSALTSSNSFDLRSKLFLSFWTTRTLILSFLGILGPWAGQIWGQCAPPNWSKRFGLDFPYLIPTSFHPVPAVPENRNRQIGISMHFGPIWAALGAPGPNFGAICSSKLVQKLRPGPPLPCSNFVPCCSSRSGPP